MELANDKQTKKKGKEISQATIQIAFADPQHFEKMDFQKNYFEQYDIQKINTKMSVNGVKSVLQKQTINDQTILGVKLRPSGHSQYMTEVYSINKNKEFLEEVIQKINKDLYTQIVEGTLRETGTILQLENSEKIMLCDISGRQFTFVTTLSKIFDTESSLEDLKVFDKQQIQQYFNDLINKTELKKISKSLLEYNLIKLVDNSVVLSIEDSKDLEEILHEILNSCKNVINQYTNVEKTMVEQACKEYKGSDLFQLPVYKKDTGYFEHHKFEKFEFK